MLSDQNQTINIVSCVDDNYVMPLAVMFKSLEATLGPKRNATAYIFCTHLSSDSKARLRKSIGSTIALDFIEISTEPFRQFKIDGHISVAAYYRFLIPAILPPEVKKVIYLDCDLVINANIGLLWDEPLQGKMLAAVPEQALIALYVSSPDGLLNYKELGLDPQRKYFNNGVMVLDLEKMRARHITEKLIAYARDNQAFIRWWDQDCYNAILHDQWKELDCRWNLLKQLFDNPAWNDGPIKDRKLYEETIKHPYIVHFNTNIKPWDPRSRHPFRKLFFKYLDMTDWAGWRPLKCPFNSYFIVADAMNFLRRVRGLPAKVKRLLVK